jgi:methylmalonyl-CoA/ethylmalonyl-CoA epimerase
MIAAIPGLVFHHVGVACRDLDLDERMFVPLGYTREGDDFTDVTQGVRGRFMTGGGPRVELLVELQSPGPLAPWLRKGVKLYHFCYEAADFTDGARQLLALGAKPVSAAVPAVAFAGRRIAFYMMPNLVLIELLSAV